MVRKLYVDRTLNKLFYSPVNSFSSRLYNLYVILFIFFIKLLLSMVKLKSRIIVYLKLNTPNTITVSEERKMSTVRRMSGFF